MEAHMAKIVLSLLKNLKKWNVEGYAAHGYIGETSSEEDDNGDWIKADDVEKIITQIEDAIE